MNMDWLSWHLLALLWGSTARVSELWVLSSTGSGRGLSLPTFPLLGVRLDLRSLYLRTFEPWNYNKGRAVFGDVLLLLPWKLNTVPTLLSTSSSLSHCCLTDFKDISKYPQKHLKVLNQDLRLLHCPLVIYTDFPSRTCEMLQLYINKQNVYIPLSTSWKE